MHIAGLDDESGVFLRIAAFSMPDISDGRNIVFLMNFIKIGGGLQGNAARDRADVRETSGGKENAGEAATHSSQQEGPQAHLDGQGLDAALDAGGDEGAEAEAGCIPDW
ncbi:hypothetical protein RAD15_25570 [Bradyrhizobium sp. 14AA]